jgi:small neutral amino acid transporter SnatA (MarC family)
MTIVTRLMGLILAAVAVEFIIDGVALLLPGWTALRQDNRRSKRRPPVDRQATGG